MGANTASPAWRLGDLHHLGLTVADIERSITFYRDILGMTLHRRRPHVDNDYVASQTGYPGVVLNVASFKVSPDSAQSLEVVQYMNHAGPPAETATNRAGNSHLCITVNDLRACHADLQMKGVRFKSDPVTITAGPNAGGLVVYFYDPDGYTLELFQPAK
jgi:catechol 2,3-dioxygenase-like lactoylglutathione lyase family enzyme